MNPNIERFVYAHIEDNLEQILLHKSKYVTERLNRCDFEIAINQIFARQHYQSKFCKAIANSQFVFGSKIAMEQASSELTADYKASIIPNYHTSIDLTGGLGIDSIAFSKKSLSHCYNESNSELVDIFKNNCNILNLHNITFYNSDAERLLIELIKNNRHFDIAYIDPSRRDNNNRKCLLLNDLNPNILKLQTLLMRIANVVIVKLSPLFDISKAIKDILNVSQIHIISVDNECKEFILVLDKNSISIDYIATDIHSANGEIIINCLQPSSEKDNTSLFSMPLKYIYEPNSSIMKLGFWQDVCVRYNCAKLHPNTHLFTSHKFISDFPGRCFSILSVSKYNRDEVKSLINCEKANITRRNFPYSVNEIRKKLGLKEGGEFFLFATTLLNRKFAILVTKKI